MNLRLPAALILVLAVGACAPLQTGSTYSREQMGRAATVMGGVILAFRDVQISGTKSGVGATAGAAAGAAGGSMVGGNVEANLIGAIAGAVIGGVVGAVAEQQLTAAGAVEFVVRQDNGQTIAVVQTNEDDLRVGERVLVLRSDRVRLIRDGSAMPLLNDADPVPTQQE